MRQGGLLAAVSLLLWSAGPPAPAPPSSLDGGVADAGRDAGADGGLDAGPLARWTFYEPGQVADAGATDLVELSVGAWVEVALDKPVVLTVCDAPLAAVEERPRGLRFTGLDAGATHCGLWFFRNAFPQRYVEVRVAR